MDPRTAQIIALPEVATVTSKHPGRLLVAIPPTELPTVKALPHAKRLQWSALQLRELKRAKKAERKRARKARKKGR